MAGVALVSGDSFQRHPNCVTVSGDSPVGRQSPAQCCQATVVGDKSSTVEQTSPMGVLR